jgi:peptidoglycan LD-endopeptidase CwlK
MGNEKFDKISIERIKTAHPKLREDLEKIYHEANNRLGKSRLRFAYVFRSFEEQTKLFRSGKNVTKADAGQSYHNYGLAVDIVLLLDKNGDGIFETASWDTKADWDKDNIADWVEVVKVFEKYGWEWGGSWKSFKDLPHFQKTFGYKWQQLKVLHAAKKVDSEGYVLI